MISVISLHWDRTENTHKIIESLKGSDLVDDVIVWNNNHKKVFHSNYPWVRVVNTSCDFGMETRYIAALLAKNDTILFIDDDNLLPQESIAKLYDAWLQEPDIIHTLDGRQPGVGNTYSSSRITSPMLPGGYRESPMSLTRCTMISKKYMSKYFEVVSKIREGLEEVKSLPPMPNEDIIMSYVVMAETGKLQKVHYFPREELPYGCNSICQRSGHMELRTQTMRKCHKYAGVLTPQETKSEVKSCFGGKCCG